MLGFFKSKQAEIDTNSIIKEGWLSKESKYRKVWRERWTVLTTSVLATFESEKNYSSPTEVVEISKIKTIKSDDNTNSFIFRVETNEGTFLFQARSFEEKEAWLGSIGKAMVKQSSSNLFINEEE